MIVDEFHESQTWEFRVREMLSALEAEHKWGLSGTPPLHCGASVAQVAKLLGFIVPCSVGNVMERAAHYVKSVNAMYGGNQLSRVAGVKAFKVCHHKNCK